jgi:hypothetical protein
MADLLNNPTLALPLSGEGTDANLTFSLSGKGMGSADAVGLKLLPLTRGRLGGGNYS